MTDEQLNEWAALQSQDKGELAREILELRRALRYGAGAAINELTAHNLPQEWSPRSGIGVMLAALRCKSIRLDAVARAALEDKP